MSDFGDRMKLYEGLSDQMLMPLIPTCARIDGRAFHSWTKGLHKPYDDAFRSLMIKVTNQLVEETGARIAHTFSDEISLIFIRDNFESEIFFGGRHQKMCSVLASLTTGFFINSMHEAFPNNKLNTPSFDCRVWSVPNLDEASNYLVWREQDAVRNSVQMAARSVYSQKECFKKNSEQLQEMLFQKGINWNDYLDMHKRGCYLKKVKILRAFTTAEISKLPMKHEARINPDLKIERSSIVVLNLPPITRLEHALRVKAFFDPEYTQ